MATMAEFTSCMTRHHHHILMYACEQARDERDLCQKAVDRITATGDAAWASDLTATRLLPLTKKLTACLKRLDEFYLLSSEITRQEMTRIAPKETNGSN